MTTRLADRLSKARRRRFIGRDDELALFAATLTASELPFCVLYIYGPGGVGKTTLLGEFAAYCLRHNIPVLTLDGRNIEPVPETFLAMLHRAMNLAPGQTPALALAAHSGRQVLLVDTFELLTPLDDWLRDVFLPQLPDDLLVVLTGRNPPALAWRADPGWQSLVHTLQLRNLSPDETLSYLQLREVPSDQHAAMLDFTHGHPLALSLVADSYAQRPGMSFQPEVAPDVIKTLLEQFVQKVPGPAHRAALEACAMVRLTTEGLLAELLAFPDVHELFEWLRDLSFVEASSQGLFPHDLARDALDADVRWRNPDWYAELHRRARAYYGSRLQQSRGRDQQRALMDYIYLHRHNPIIRPFFAWQEGGSMGAEPPRPDDWPLLLAMVARHEGQESARLATHWFERQPLGVTVFRDIDGSPAGFLAIVALDRARPEDLEEDPATRAAWRYLQHQVPPRPGELATMFRFWMARDTYQDISPVQSLIGVTMIRHYLMTPGLAFSFFPCADANFWAPLSAYAHLDRIPAADFTVGGRTYGVYGHDWRTMPWMTWLTVLAEQELSAGVQIAPPKVDTGLLVLSQEDFAAALRSALHDLERPEALRANPLLRTRLVVERAGTGDAVATLQELIRTACETLQNSPRDLKLYRALYHAYLHPAPTQEQAAEMLDLPFSTFRRHVKSGLALVTEQLWNWELQGANK